MKYFYKIDYKIFIFNILYFITKKLLKATLLQK